jgi:hypothetical protein
MNLNDRTKAWVALLVLMLAYTALFAAEYPPISGIEDETGFLNQALVWSRGAVSAEGAGFAHGLPDFIAVNGRRLPARHPGRSLVALPFLVLGGTRATFASGLLLHLLTTATAGLLLEKLGRSPLWAVLVLFHPTLALYSRTIMADGAAGCGLLLAGLGIVCGAPVRAGVAVGVAAAMRYHAALALPLVAASFVFPRTERSSRPWRDAALCLLGGAAVGCVLATYNVAVYGTLNEPFTRERGYFSPAFVLLNTLFYGTVLLLIWPGMLIAPMLDTSRLRWFVRGSVVLFLGPLLFYYFHDVAAGWLETLVVGQRLIQIALPLWIVSYACVLTDMLAAPRLRGLSDVVRTVVAPVICVGLLTGTALMFARHQHHLEGLREARDAFVSNVPGGSLVVYQGSLTKIVGTPRDVPEYRFRALEFEGKPAEDPAVLYRDLDHEHEHRPWFFAILHRQPGDHQLTSDYVHALVKRYAMEEIAIGSPLVSLYVARE